MILWLQLEHKPFVQAVMGWPGGKEYPVSDDEKGLPPSKRPDPKTAPDAPEMAQEGRAESRKSRLRRRTRRPGRKDGVSDGKTKGDGPGSSTGQPARHGHTQNNGAQDNGTTSNGAQNNGAQKNGTKGQEVSNSKANGAEAKSASSPFPETRPGGKRRRRRKGRRKAAKTAGTGQANTHAAGEKRPGNQRTRDKDHRPPSAGNHQQTNRARSPRGGPRRTDKHAQPLYAALDLGTNNCRLLIATPQRPGRFRVVDAFSRIVRLGEGLGRSGMLSDAAMDRSVEALKACAGKLKQRDIKSLRLIATEACRRAENGAAFLQRVERETGMRLEIVDRETEARLAVAGCSSLIDRESKGVVLFDIGGGSSELALLDLRKRRRNDFGPAMISWTSLPVGVVTLSERHGGGRQVTRDVFEAMVAEVEGMLSDYEGRDALAEAANEGDIHLLGTSGTVTTLAGIHLELPKYDRRRVDGVWMGSRQTGRIVDQLVDMSFEERMQNPCIGRDRADLVLAGCAILVAIQKLWPYPRLRVADRGLREGLLMEMMNADNVWRQDQRGDHRKGPKR